MKEIVSHPLFVIGLSIRLIFIFTIEPSAVSNWYAPFLDFSISKFTFDPWTYWLFKGGDQAAFPYGYAMWIVFIPLSLFGKLSGLPILYSYDFTILLADFCLLYLLLWLIPNRKKLVFLTYWLSPITIFAGYGLGLNDLIPALLLVLSILFIRHQKLVLAGVFLAISISAKLSMVVAIPFFGVYLFNNRSLRQLSSKFLFGFFGGALSFGGPFVLSSGGKVMLFGNPEMGKIYQLSIGLAGNLSLFVVPLAYLILLYLAWRIRRLNFDLFQALIGMAFLLIVLTTPASPGWFVWCLPFLVIFQAGSGRKSMLLVVLFSIAYVMTALLLEPIQLANGKEFSLGAQIGLPVEITVQIASLLHTIMVGMGLVLAIKFWREAFDENDFFRLTRKPFAIGIAGDSGSGKDTLADAITLLFGRHSAIKLSGDDYHLWDRQKPIWQVMTHLNPMANDLEGFCNDLMSLADGKSILSRNYDHKTGKMSKPSSIRSNDFIIASGLHSLYLPVLRECYHLKIFLDIDEGLRKHFKINRDINLRGHTKDQVLKSLAKRKPDSDQFIRPQAKYADLILSLQPVNSGSLNQVDNDFTPSLRLNVKTRNRFNELSIHRVLVGVCGLQVDVIVSDDGSELELVIEGESTADDIALAAEMLCPKLQEFLDIPPQWQDGMIGLMQLITVTHINQALIKRVIG